MFNASLHPFFHSNIFINNIGIFLVYDFWTPPPINFVHGSDR